MSEDLEHKNDEPKSDSKQEEAAINDGPIVSFKISNDKANGFWKSVGEDFEASEEKRRQEIARERESRFQKYKAKMLASGDHEVILDSILRELFRIKEILDNRELPLI